jgi:hypothetical protein
MKPTFTVAACATFLWLLALAQSATAEPKTTSQCNADWAANKASIQASGKTKRAFVAECRGVLFAARKPAALDKNQYTTEADAKANCSSDAVVWVNSLSMVYHPNGSRNYGRTKTGAYMCEQESLAAGFRAPKVARRAAI